MKKIVSVAVILSLSGCAGSQLYTPPKPIVKIDNSVIIQKSKEEAWKKIIPELGKKFFVINNLDKESGLINVSYSGDPEKYIDCGTVEYTVTNMYGKRDYIFPGAKADQRYEIMTPTYFIVHREMSLEGRMNIIIEPEGLNSSRLTANTKYLVTKTVLATDQNSHNIGPNNTIMSFNTGGSAHFSENSTNGNEAMCQSTGTFEKEIIDIFK